MTKKFDVIVIGGGASGMIAAGRAASLGKSVLLIEKNKKLGEKLKITGGGRCNITNTEPNHRKFMSNYGSYEKFLYSPFSVFGVPETINFFKSIGIEIVTQARNRAFPSTEKAIDVFNALYSYIKDHGVLIEANNRVLKISHQNNEIGKIITNKGEYYAKNYIFATGGLSHPETGSTGDGFNWLKDLGHSVVSPTPTIVPIKTLETWVHRLAGVSLSFMKITFFLDNKKVFSKTGKILFTHFGLSGPLILNSASQIKDMLENGSVTAKIDLYPDTDESVFEKNIINIFDKNKNKKLKNVFNLFVPEGLQTSISDILKDIDVETKVHSITKDQRRYIVQRIKSLPITITGLMGYDRAVIADGGVYIEEVDTKTFKSKKIKNLFITGDLLHIRRPSGGFSLQLCWTSGYISGSNV